MFRISIVVLATTLCCQLLLMNQVNAAMALFSSKSSTTRYFTHEGMLPPLSLSALPSNSTTIPYSVSEASVIPVTYTNNPKTVYQWLSENLPPEGCILGVDIEAVPPGMYRPKGAPRTSPFESASTVQLATTDSCLVVHLVRNSGRFSFACAPILKAILSDERYIKAGCAIDGDFISLREIWGPSFQATSRLDLGLVGIPPQRKKARQKFQYDKDEKKRTRIKRQNKEETTTKPTTQHKKPPRTRYGLKSLCRSLLGIDLPKPQHIAMSDWSTVPLNDAQIIYSARDAWAGAAIANKLAEYDPETFHPGNLMHVLSSREPSIAVLAKRKQRRDRAKRDLSRLLKPYQAKPKDLPKRVYEKAQDLRGVIKERIIDPKLVFETDHLEFDI